MKQLLQRSRVLRSWLGLLLLAATSLTLVNCASTSEQASVPTSRWFHSLRESVFEHVEDAGRARKALAVIDRADLEVLSFLDEAERQARTIKALNADYHASRADFEAAFAKSDASRHAVLDTVLDSLDELRDLVEPEEWSAFEFSESLIDAYHTAKNRKKS